jgi:hypothetical protein
VRGRASFFVGGSQKQKEEEPCVRVDLDLP